MASRWDTRGGSSRRTWLAEARKINEDLHREIMLTEADYAWDHLFSGISLWREQSIHHMQPQLTSWHTRLLIKSPSLLPDPRHMLVIVWAPSTFMPCGRAAEWSDVWSLPKISNAARHLHHLRPGFGILHFGKDNAAECYRFVFKYACVLPNVQHWHHFCTAGLFKSLEEYFSFSKFADLSVNKVKDPRTLSGCSLKKSQLPWNYASVDYFTATTVIHSASWRDYWLLSAS